MRSRAVVITLAFYLSFALLACSKKGPENAPSSDTTSPTATQDETGGSAAQNQKVAKSEKAEKARPAAAPKVLVVPAGTIITVRLGQSVGSKISQPGETFSATVATPVEIDGKTAIAAGSTASGTVVDAKPLGRFKGGAALEVRLDSVNISGTDHPIQTSPLTREAKGKGKRTAVMAGGGAGLGALIGGLTGGGKGAAIGALAGGGAGTAGAAFTGNKDIVLPAESALRFKLNQPLEVR
jgi:predicted small lipoprotein YifL